MKIIYFFAVLLFLPVVTAVPIINGATGDFSTDGSTITIIGTQFGTHTLDVRADALGSDGWIETNTPGTDVLSLSNADVGWTTSLNQISHQAEVQSNSAIARTGSQYVDASVDEPITPYMKRPWGYTNSQKFDKVYFSVYMYFLPENWLGDITSFNTKGPFIAPANRLPVHHQACSVLQLPPYGNVRWTASESVENYYYYNSEMFSVCASNTNCFEERGTLGWIDYCLEHAEPVPFYDTDNIAWLNRGGTQSNSILSPAFGKWQRISFYAEASDIDAANGEVWYWLMKEGEANMLAERWINIKNHQSCCIDRGYPQDEWGKVVFYGYSDAFGYDHDNNPDTPRIGNTDNRAAWYWDDPYIQFGTQARVELGNSPDYYSATKLDVQPPVRWDSSGDHIEVNLNYGTFNLGEDAWLFVIDENGNISDGHYVKLGEEPSGPYIYGVSDSTPDDGQTITLDGVNFGSHASVSDVWFLGGSDGFIEQATPGYTWDGGTDVLEVPRTTKIYGNGGSRDHFDATESWSGSQSMNFEVDTAAGGTFGSTYAYLHPTGAEEFYITFWTRTDIHVMPPVFVNSDGDSFPPQIKYWSLTTDNTPCQPNRDPLRSNNQRIMTGVGFQGADPSDFEQTPAWGAFTMLGQETAPYYNDEAFLEGETIGYAKPSQHYYWSLFNRGRTGPDQQFFPDWGTWNRVEFHVKTGSWNTYDGYGRFAVYKPEGQYAGRQIGFEMDKIRLNFDDGSYTGITGDGLRCQPQLPNAFTWYHYFDNPNEPTDPKADIRIDDPYIQVGTQARIELCNNENWDDVTSCEIQKPITWASDRETIKFQVNFGGSFVEDETAYLFVIHDNGSVSPGYAITLGAANGGSGVPGPTCFDGIQNGDETGVDCGGVCVACDVPVVGAQLVLQNGLDNYDGLSASSIKNGWECEFCDVTYPGDSTVSKIDGSFVNKWLLHFVLPDLSDKVLLDAHLELYETNEHGSDTDVRVSRVLRSWSPSGVTYVCANDEDHDGCVDVGEIGWSSQGLLSDSDREILDSELVLVGWNSWNVTAAVRDWLNNPEQNLGFLVEETEEVSQVFSGKDSGVLSPKLVLTFQDSGCTPSQFDLVGTDCTIDFDDFMQVVAAFRTTDTTYDFNNDNHVNILDLVLHLLNWS